MDGGFKKMAPQAAILISTLLWGTLWIPLREINESGVNGATATALSFLLGLAVLLPFALLRARRILAGGWPLAASGFFLALCIALYSEGMVRGEVARVLLLFYLTPVWSTLLARLMLGQPITRRRVATIALGLFGMAVILGDGMSLPVPRSAADWMGLASGVAWGLAMVYLQRTAARRNFDRIFAALVFLAPIYFLVTLIPGSRDSVGVEGAIMADWVVILVTLAVIWLMPIVGLTVYGASRMDPGMVAIFLMFEVIVGLASAAWLLDEPFGPREIIGAGFIIAAMLSEVVIQDSPRSSRK
jgi:drug/metabolite transporter (DMT)-like permease